MARTLTNNTQLSLSKEASVGVLEGSPVWYLLEPNGGFTVGATTTKVARNPISKDRQRRKGTITDIESGVEFSTDLTMSMLELIIQEFVFAQFQGARVVSPTAVTTSAYTVPTMASAVAQNYLVRGFGFDNEENNGLKLVDTGGTTTSIPIDGGGMVAESPAATKNATVEVAGYRFPSGDLEVDADGNLITTTTDFTTLPFVVGQQIWIGGDETVNSFANAANRGYARITAIDTNLLTIDKKNQTFVTDAGTAKLIDVYFGRMVQNVDVEDALFYEKSLQVEATYKDLISVGTDGYEYAKGNYQNTLGFAFPKTDKATMDISMIGTDTPAPTSTRATNADAPLEVTKTEAFNTSADIARIRVQKVDETGITTDFNDLNISLNNNVVRETVLGQAGAKYLGFGNFEIDIESQIYFDDVAVLDAIRNNTTLGFDFAVRNNEGAIAIDVPSCTAGDGSKDLTENESIKQNLTLQADSGNEFGASLIVSIFPYVPAA